MDPSVDTANKCILQRARTPLHSTDLVADFPLALVGFWIRGDLAGLCWQRGLCGRFISSFNSAANIDGNISVEAKNIMGERNFSK